jgi:hypothetical protein
LQRPRAPPVSSLLENARPNLIPPSPNLLFHLGVVAAAIFRPRPVRLVACDCRYHPILMGENATVRDHIVSSCVRGPRMKLAPQQQSQFSPSQPSHPPGMRGTSIRSHSRSSTTMSAPLSCPRVQVRPTPRSLYLLQVSATQLPTVTSLTSHHAVVSFSAKTRSVFKTVTGVDTEEDTPGEDSKRRIGSFEFQPSAARHVPSP